ncbi:cubilin-like, partial [Ruditapes philippinarum]|uniref:cubilin-like n=1 Tax=Ruditapes philippinarum TaxID=129788 RepID=UPI00295B8D26
MGCEAGHQHNIAGQCDDATRPLQVNITSLPYYVSSPNYPEFYEPNSDCAWILKAPSPSDRITVNIEFLNLEGITAPCKYDYLAIYDGVDTSATQLAKLCWANDDDINALVSSSDTLYATLTSDYAVQYEGFNMLVFSNSSDLQPACDGSSNLTASTERQYIMSPNFPYEYESNFSCIIRIYPQTLYYGVTFNMTFLDIEVSKGCANDALRFISVGEESSVDTAVVCTRAVDYEHTNFPLDVTGNYIEIEFTTNSADNFYGFMFSFTEVFKGINLTSPNNEDTIEITVPEDLTTGRVNDTVCVIVLTYTGSINLQITPLYEATTDNNITDQDTQLFALIDEPPYVYLDLVSSLNYEVISKFTLLATLIDSDVPQVTYTVTFNVTVSDVDDVAPVFLNLPGNYTLSRGQKTDEVIFTVNATDYDISDEFSNILFTIE